MIEAAKRIAGVEEYYFSTKLRQIAQWQAAGREVINLGIGSPDLPPSAQVVKALNTAAEVAGNHGYQSYQGLPALREAIAGFYLRMYGVNLSSSTEILPLLGSKEGIMYLSQAYLNEGDAVLVPNPGYPAYAAAARMAGAIVVNYSLKAENNYEPDFNEIQDLIKKNPVKLMWINYPHMPTGAAASKELFHAFAHLARKYQFILANDNPYGLLQNSKPLSLLAAGAIEAFPCVELNSLSKSFNMAGWRVGMLCGNAEILKNVLKVKSNVDSGMFKPVQLGAIEALKLDNDWFAELQAEYQTRRAMAQKFFDQLGCRYRLGQEGMFVWAQIPGNWPSGEALVEHLLENDGIFITPGFIFGSEGEKFVRVSLCSTSKTFEYAIEKVKKLDK